MMAPKSPAARPFFVAPLETNQPATTVMMSI